MSDVSIKSTKTEIFNAYQAALTQLKAAKAHKVDPQAVAKEKKDTELKATAINVERDGGLVACFQNFKTQLNGTVRGLESTIDGYADDLNNMVSFIAGLRDELQELWGISAEAESLNALVQARHAWEADFQADRVRAEIEHREKLAAREAEYTKRSKELALQATESHAAKVETLQREHAQWAEDFKREREQAWYNFDRERQRTRDDFADEIKQKRKEFEADVAEHRAELADREAILMSREKEVDALMTDVATLTDKLQQAQAQQAVAVEEAVKKAKADAQAQLAAAVGSTKATLEAENRILSERIADRASTIERMSSELQGLRDELKAAYQKINDVALRSLDSTHQAQAASQVRSFAEQATNAMSKAKS